MPQVEQLVHCNVQISDSNGEHISYIMFQYPAIRMTCILSLAEFIVMSNLFHLGELILASVTPLSHAAGIANIFANHNTRTDKSELLAAS